jgi:hypothetical protein
MRQSSATSAARRPGTKRDTVSPRGQLERLLVRHGVDSFCVLEEEASVTLRLTVGDRQVQLMVPLPDRWSEEFTRTPTGKVRLLSAQERVYEREVRRRWTALRVLATGKLMADAYGISDLADDYPVAVEVSGREGHEPDARRANGKRYVRLSKALLPLVGLAAVIPASSIAAVSLSPGTVERLVTPLASARPDVLAGNATTQRVALGIQPVASSNSGPVQSHVQVVGEVVHSSSRVIAAESTAPPEPKSEPSSTPAAASVVSAPPSTASTPSTETSATSDVSITEPAASPTADPGKGQGQGSGPGNGGPGDGGGKPGNGPGDGGGKPGNPGDGGGKPGKPGDPGSPGGGKPGKPGPGDGGKPGNPDPGDPSKPGNPDPGDPSKPGNPDPGGSGNKPGNPDPGNPGGKPGNPDPGAGGGKPGNPGDPGDGSDPGAGSAPAPDPGSAPAPGPPPPPATPGPGPKPPKPGH